MQSADIEEEKEIYKDSDDQTLLKQQRNQLDWWAPTLEIYLLLEYIHSLLETENKQFE